MVGQNDTYCTRGWTSGAPAQDTYVIPILADKPKMQVVSPSQRMDTVIEKAKSCIARPDEGQPDVPD